MGLLPGHGRLLAVPSLDDLLGFFKYPPRSARALLDGVLPLRFCTARLFVLFRLGVFLRMVMLLPWLLRVVRRLVLWYCWG